MTPTVETFSTTTIWVVEMWCRAPRRWLPTVGVGLSRTDGRDALADWQRQNPDDKFRLRQYGRLDKAEKN
jgi:hypothetical protein